MILPMMLCYAYMNALSYMRLFNRDDMHLIQMREWRAARFGVIAATIYAYDTCIIAFAMQVFHTIDKEMKK